MDISIFEQNFTFHIAILSSCYDYSSSSFDLSQRVFLSSTDLIKGPSLTSSKYLLQSKEKDEESPLGQASSHVSVVHSNRELLHGQSVTSWNS